MHQLSAVPASGKLTMVVLVLAALSVLAAGVQAGNDEKAAKSASVEDEYVPVLRGVKGFQVGITVNDGFMVAQLDSAKLKADVQSELWANGVPIMADTSGETMWLLCSLDVGPEYGPGRGDCPYTFGAQFEVMQYVTVPPSGTRTLATVFTLGRGGLTFERAEVREKLHKAVQKLVDQLSAIYRAQNKD